MHPEELSLFCRINLNLTFIMMEVEMRTLFLTLIAGAFAALTFTAAANADVTSLRGANKLEAPAKMFDKKRVETVTGGIKRSWKLQPPSIPHKIGKESINLETNTCLRCHGAEFYKKEKAPEIGLSHFVDAAGKKQETLNMRRYFCTQCHTTQVGAKPLVPNTF